MLLWTILLLAVMSRQQGRFLSPLIQGGNIGFISTGSFYTIIYLAERFLKESGVKNPKRLHQLREILSGLLDSLEIAELSREFLFAGANDMQFKDLEDSCQLQAAKISSCPCLITTNKKGLQRI